MRKLFSKFNNLHLVLVGVFGFVIAYIDSNYVARTGMLWNGLTFGKIGIVLISLAISYMVVKYMLFGLVILPIKRWIDSRK